MDPVVLRNIEVEIDRPEVERVLGNIGRRPLKMREGPSKPRIERALGMAGELIEPAAIYTITVGERLLWPSIFAGLERVAVCVCTIGPALEAKVAELSRLGEVLEAMVLDAAGSVAAEATADYVDGRITEIAAESGERASRRASPGYGDWGVTGQKGVFSVLPAERIGVKLGPGMMMLPRKSVSFAIHVAKEPLRLRSEKSCGNCDDGDCPYRKE